MGKNDERRRSKIKASPKEIIVNIINLKYPVLHTLPREIFSMDIHPNYFNYPFMGKLK